MPRAAPVLRLRGMDLRDRPVLRSHAWLVAAVALAVIVLGLATAGVEGPGQPGATLLAAGAGAVTVLAWAQTRVRRERRAHEDELTAWAAERAAQAERLQLARDLHDLASHGLGLITVRAASARLVTGPGRDAEHAAALADIERAGRAATTELRRLLTVLRTPGTRPPLTPSSGLADLSPLVEQAATNGVRACLVIERPASRAAAAGPGGAVSRGSREVADLGPISAGTQLLAYAVVREALSNTARHAGPARAEVALRREPDALVVTVTDVPDEPAGPGAVRHGCRWAPAPGAGVGLAQLAERLATLGGVLQAGPAPTGYRVVARLPEPQDVGDGPAR